LGFTEGSMNLAEKAIAKAKGEVWQDLKDNYISTSLMLSSKH
jgi:hypothetical protein